MGDRSEYNKAYHQKRYYSDPEYRAKRLAYRSRTPEENSEYMRKYYAENKEKWPRRTREQQDRYNQTRREKYASDTEFRERIKTQAKSGCPRKKRDGRLRSTFGITVDDYERMHAEQRGLCAICGRPEGSDKSSRSKTGIRRLHVDHCHATGRVRGLLCGACNFGIGSLGDSPDRLRAAAEYLQRSMGDMGRPKR